MLIHNSYFIRASIFFIFLLSISSCKWFGGKENCQINTGTAEDFKSVKIVRFEEELFKIAPNNLLEGLQALRKKNPDFYDIYFERVLQVTSNAGDYNSYTPLVLDFLTNKYVKGLYDTTQSHFPDLKQFESEMNKAMKNYVKHFPDSTVPTIYTFISEFGNQAFTFEKCLGVGIDMYLGVDYPYYKSSDLNFPAFMVERFTPKNMVINAVNVMSTDLMTELPQNGFLLDHMIYYGKSCYFMEKILPFRKQYELINYSKENWEWCELNEGRIWEFFVGKELLFSPGMLDFKKYLEDAPTTSGMPAGAPGKVGVWTGWMIVRKYMDENPDVSLSELMKMDNSRAILEGSGYKPRVTK